MIKLKKGQIISEVLKYLLVGVTAILILVGGYKMVNLVKERACKTEIAKFEIDLRDIDKNLRFGTKELQRFAVPCKVDQIYFFDLNKKIDPENFNDTVILKDALTSGSNSNVYLVKEEDVKRSFYAGNLEIKYPHYICFVPKFGRISFFVEGTGKSAIVTSASEQPECTLMPVNISQSEGESIIDEAANNFPALIPNSAAEKQKIELTKRNVEIFRKFSQKDRKTKVEITIRVRRGLRLDEFRYYESIPKECVDDLQRYIEERTDDDAQVNIKADPLIIWSFGEIRGQRKISYKLNKELDSECRQLIKGLAVAQSVVNI